MHEKCSSVHADCCSLGRRRGVEGGAGARENRGLKGYGRREYRRWEAGFPRGRKPENY